jgi:ABC-2 type transport system ATP-binding protein
VSAIRVRGLTKRFGFREALRDVSLTAAPGECLAVVGRNGSGKSTLVRILATLARPTSGEAEIAGHSLPREAAAARASLGVVLDHPMLPRDLTLADGLGLYSALLGVADPEGRIASLASQFGLSSRLDDPVRTFSRGMGQRAALCRALLADPPVLLLDEPTTGLDAAGCATLAAAVRDARARGRCVLLVTHDLAFVAVVAQRAVLLEAGAVAAEGTPGEVIARVHGEGAAA